MSLLWTSLALIRFLVARVTVLALPPKLNTHPAAKSLINSASFHPEQDQHHCVNHQSVPKQINTHLVTLPDVTIQREIINQRPMKALCGQALLHDWFADVKQRD